MQQDNSIEYKFKIVKPVDEKEELRRFSIYGWIFITLIFIYLINESGWFFQQQEGLSILVALFIAILVFTVFIIVVKERYRVPSVANENLILNELFINHQDTKIELKAISNLKLFYFGKLGDVGKNPKHILLGNENYIEFKHQDAHYKQHFFLETEKDKMRLKALIKKWYEHKIPFKEYYLDRRSFLFDYLNYDEIQKVKTQYGIIDW